MKVSVIVPAYNIESYIGRCLESIIRQKINDIEIIVVNDGSTDNTLEIVKDYRGKYSNIKIIDKKNEGSIEARKSGLTKARGEYILFIDGDDWIEDNTINLLYKKAKKNCADIVLYNGYWAYDDYKKILRSFNINEDIKSSPLISLFMNNINPGIVFKFIKREYINKNQIMFPENISFAEDLATSASLFMHNPKIEVVNNSLYNYYQRSTSISKQVSDKILDVDKAIEFIREQLIINSIYDEIEKEFERMVYTHMFSERILGAEKLYSVHKILYIKYKSRNIKVNQNIYLNKLIKEKYFFDKIRIKCYLINYDLGRIYDCLKTIIKKFLLIDNWKIRRDSL